MIRKILFFIATVIFVFLIQMLCTRIGSIGGVFPNLFLLATTFFALRLGPLSGECLGFVFGIISDGIAISLFGSHTFALTLTGYTIGHLKGKIDEERPLAQIIMVLCVSLIIAGILFALESLFGGVTERYHLSISIGQSLYTALSAPIGFPLLNLWKRFFD